MKLRTAPASVTGCVAQGTWVGLCAGLLALSAGCAQSPQSASLRVAFTTTAGNQDRTFVDPPDSLVMLLGQPPHNLGYAVAATVYAGTYGGVLASWSVEDGTTRYIRPTVVRRPFPAPVTTPSGAIMIAPEDRIAASFGLHVDGDRVFVLAHADEGKVADVYEAATGEYRHSFHLPDQEATGIAVSGGRYVFAADTIVSVWEHRPSSQ